MRASWLLFGVIPLFISCDSLCVESLPKSGEIKIDGEAAEWGGKLRRSDNLPFSIGAINDSETLYLCINAYGQITRQIAGFGLTLRFKSSKLPKEGFAIKYPIGENNPFIQGRRPQREDGQWQKPVMVIPDMVQITVLKDSVHHEFSLAGAESLGLQLSAKLSENHFVYELKIPFNGDTALGLPAGNWSDSLFQVEFSSEVPDFALKHPEGTGPGDGMGPPGGGMGGGMRPPGGGGFGGGMGGGGPDGGGRGGGMMPPGGGRGPGKRMQMQPPEPIKAEVSIKLAKNP